MSYMVGHFGIGVYPHIFPLCNSPNKNAHLVWAREVVTCKRCNRRLREGFLDKEPRVGGRKQMVMQLPIKLIDAVHKHALERTILSGSRVTQQQVVEAILTKELL